MDFDGFFQEKLDALHKEGRYRVFTDIQRHSGEFPRATRFTGETTQDVTVWCSNDYLGMGQNPAVLAAMHEALDTYGAGAGVAPTVRGDPPLRAASRPPLPAGCRAEARRASRSRP